MIRKAGHELVLYYNPEVSSKVMKLKGVLVRMGVRIRNVAPEQVLQPVGTLAGISGYERTENGAVQETELPAIPDEMLVMHGFTGRRIDELLLGLRKAGVPKVELKANGEGKCDRVAFHKTPERLRNHRNRPALLDPHTYFTASDGICTVAAAGAASAASAEAPAFPP